MRAAATALLVLLLVAPALSQEPPAVDRALLAQFVAADAAGRDALAAARPELREKAFRDFLISEGARLRRAGDVSKADAHARAAIHIGERFNHPEIVVVALNELVQLAAAGGDLDVARDLANRALALATSGNDLRGQQISQSSLAILDRRIGDLASSRARQTIALDLARQVGDRLMTARALHNLGLVTQNLGENAKALEYYVESLAIKTEAKAPSNDFVVTLIVIGTIYAEQNEYELAASYYQRAIDAAGSEMSANVAGAYNNMGQTQIALGNIEAAKKTFEKAVPFAQQTRNLAAEATMVYNLGIIARLESRFADAEGFQRRALAIREQLREALGTAESLIEISNLMVRTDRLQDAITVGERAVNLATSVRIPSMLWKAQLMTARAYAMAGREADARSMYDGAIETIETLRVLAAGGNSGQRMMIGRLGPFYGLAELELRSGRTFEALATIDRGRARALIDVISIDRAATRRLSEAERAVERELTETLRRTSAQADAEQRKPQPDRARIAALDAQVRADRLRREAFLGELYAKQPDVRLARGSTSDLTPDQLMTVLTPGTAIVSYALDDKSAWVYVTTKGARGPEVTAHALPLETDAIIALSEKFARQVSSRDLAFAATARSAYDALVGAAAARLNGISRIVVIPDGPLWGMPFQALLTPRNRFLIEDTAVSYTPSIAALVALEKRRQSRTVAAPFLVALGDPAVAPAPAREAAAALRDVAPVRLPEAAREVRSLGRLYGDTKSSVLVGAAATENALRKQSARATVLHVATHGVLDNYNPMYSHLMLAPGNTAAGGDNDGRLEAWELMDMAINADIAVLSACQTARGGSGFGEGIMGLSWSLFASGASTAVVSQWQVDSASTTSLMIAFHEQLRKQTAGQRTSSAVALKNAATQLMAQPGARHPFYWAGFIAIGAK